MKSGKGISKGIQEGAATEVEGKLGECPSEQNILRLWVWTVLHPSPTTDCDPGQMPAPL